MPSAFSLQTIIVSCMSRKMYSHTAWLQDENEARPCPVWAAGKHAQALQMLAQVLQSVQAARKSGLPGVPQWSPSNPR